MIEEQYQFKENPIIRIINNYPDDFFLYAELGFKAFEAQGDILPFAIIAKSLLDSQDSAIWCEKAFARIKLFEEQVLNKTFQLIPTIANENYISEIMRKKAFWHENELPEVNEEFIKQNKIDFKNYNETGNIPDLVIESFYNPHIEGFKQNEAISLNQYNQKFSLEELPLIMVKHFQEIATSAELNLNDNFKNDLKNAIKYIESILPNGEELTKLRIDPSKAITETGIIGLNWSVAIEEHKKSHRAIKHGIDKDSSLYRQVDIPIYKAIKALNKLNPENIKESAAVSVQVKKESLGLKKEYSKEYSEKHSKEYSKDFEVLIKQLTLKLDFIDESLSKNEDFIKIMSTDDMSSISTKIHFGRDTNEVRYIFDKLKFFFTSFSYAKIQRSKLFYTKKGNPLTAGNSYSSKREKPKRFKEIDKIFKEVLK